MTNKLIEIKLNSNDDVKRFLNVTRSFLSNVDVVLGRNERNVIDGKSVLGLFAMDISKPIEVRIHSDNIAECRKFDAEMENFR